jgi:hypothetical protein
MCRALLQVPPSQQLTDADAFTFFDQVDQNLEALGIAGTPAKIARNWYETKYINVLGKEFKASPGAPISAVLRFSGSKYGLISQPFWKGFAYIFGEMVQKTHSEYCVAYMMSERMRCPSFVLSNVAAVAEHLICMRQEAFKTVFYQKWVPMFQPNPNVYVRDRRFYTISMAIKQHALKLAGVSSYEALIEKEKSFLADMQETVLYHEIGHGILKDYLFPYERTAIAQGVDHHYGLPAYEGLMEFLSDFAPETEHLWGPMWNMVKIAQKNPKRAELLFYIYLSDVFFYDTDDEYMYEYSDMMCMIMLRYIQKDLHVDFNQMKQDMLYRTSSPTADGLSNPSLFERLSEVFVADTDRVKEIVKTFDYIIIKEKRDYIYLRSLWLEETRKFFKFATDEHPAFVSSFWINIHSYVEHFSKENAPKLKRTLEKMSKTVVAKVMVLAAGRKEAQSYQFDPRPYLIDQFRQIGLDLPDA